MRRADSDSFPSVGRILIVVLLSVVPRSRAREVADLNGEWPRRGTEGPAPRHVGVQAAVTLKLQVTPKRSVSIPKPALHADAASGSTMVAPTVSASQ